MLEAVKYNEYTRKLYNSDAFFSFSNKYLNNKTITLDFDVSDEIISEFKKYLAEKSLLNVSKTSESLEKIYETAANDDLLKDIEKDLDKLSEKMTKLNHKLFDNNKKEIKVLLDYEFKRRYFNNEQLSGLYKSKDSVIIKSAQLLRSNDYNQILSVQKKSDSKQ